MSTEFSVEDYKKKLEAGQVKLRKDARHAEIRRRRLQMTYAKKEDLPSTLTKQLV